MDTSLENKDAYFHQLADDLDNLLNKEELLIRSEFREKTRDVKLSDLSYYACGIAVTTGAVFMGFAMFFILAEYIELWEAAFSVGLLFLTGAGVIYGIAREKLRQAAIPPERSLTALNEMKTSLHDKMNEITRH